MERVTTKRLSLFAGRTHPALAEEIADGLDVELGEPQLVDFANGEIRGPLRRQRAGHRRLHHPDATAATDGRSINDSIMEQLIMIDAAHRASAKRITAVCPFYGYARQDRKAEGREPITARLVADLFRAAGAKRMISVDLHSGQIQGFFDGPVDHLTAIPVLEGYLREHATDPVIVSPDAGRIKVAERMAQHLERRPRLHLQAAPQGHGQRGRRPGRHRRGRGPPVRPRRRHDRHGQHDRVGGRDPPSQGRVRGVGHGHPRRAVRPGHRPARRTRRSSGWSSRTPLPLPPEKQLPLIEVLSVAPIIADALDAVFEDTSVSEIFGGENQA